MYVCMHACAHVLLMYVYAYPGIFVSGYQGAKDAAALKRLGSFTHARASAHRSTHITCGSDSLEAPALLPHPLTPSAKSHTITLISTSPCRSPWPYVFLPADLSIVPPRTHVMIMPLTFEPGLCWHTIFFWHTMLVARRTKF